MVGRQTKYITAVREIIQQTSHATNAMILAELQIAYPDVSATTVHRITSRLVDRGELALAPPTHDNSMRFDNMVVQHDHFSCNQCDCLHDVTLPDEIRQGLGGQLQGCSLSGPLTIQGTCRNCLQKMSN